MAGDDAKREWVQRVLGYAFTGGKKLEGPLLPVWLEAKEKADAEITKLQQSLYQNGHPDLIRIAEFGLNGITDKLSVGLMVALREADAPGADAKVRAKAAQAAQSFKSFVDTDQRVALISDNPFVGDTDLRGTLSGALGEIADALTA